MSMNSKDEWLKIAKDMSVKVAGTISKLCNAYVAKVGVENTPATANEQPTANTAPTEQQEPPKA